MKSITQTFIDVKLAELHVKPLEKWSNEEWTFFAKNKNRSIQLVKEGYINKVLIYNRERE